MPLCREALSSDNWKAQHVGLVLIGILSEDAKKNFSNELDKIVNLVLPFLKSKTPKVIYSTLTCIGLLSEEFAPMLQSEYGETIIDNLIRIMSLQDENMIDLNTRAVSCSINFVRAIQREDDGEELAQEILEGYFEQFTKVISTLFQRSIQLQNFKLLSETLSLISILSNLMKQLFASSYSFFMNHIKTLLGQLSGNNLNDKQIELKGQLIDTASFLLQSVQQREELTKDVQELVNYLGGMLQNLEEDSILIKSVLTFFKVIARLN